MPISSNKNKSNDRYHPVHCLKKGGFSFVSMLLTTTFSFEPTGKYDQGRQRQPDD